MKFGQPQRTHHFITSSTFSGAWNSKLKCVDGFGHYKCADGTLYRGYLKNGYFHGFASLTVEHPTHFTFDIIFHEGHMVKIVDMKFSDGIRVQGEMKGNTFDFSKWEYCSPKDRRFSKEIIKGLKGVDSSSSLKMRELKPGTYDAECGIYNEKTGFLYAPKKFTFIQCPKDSAWFIKNCRSSREDGEVIEPSQNICEKTIISNINSRKWLNNNYGDQCACDQKPGHKYFLKLYNMEIEEARKHVGKRMKKNEMIPIVDEKSISSVSSFSDIQLKDNEVLEKICDNSKSTCLCDGSLSINMSAINTLHARYGKPFYHTKTKHRYFNYN